MMPQEIKAIRERLGLTQSQMALVALEVNQTAYAKWEQGASSPSAAAITALRLLDYLQKIDQHSGWLEAQIKRQQLKAMRKMVRANLARAAERQREQNEGA